MKSLATAIVSFFLLLLLACAPTEAAQVTRGEVIAAQSSTGRLEQTVKELIRKSDGASWIAYDVPSNDPDAQMCCFDSIREGKEKSWRGGKCSLESQQSFFTSQGDDATGRFTERTHFSLYLRAEKKRLTDLRMISSDCVVDAGGMTVHRLTGVDPQESVRFLVTLLDGGFNEDESQHAIAAISMHKAPNAIPTLEQIITSSKSEETRGHAAFWLGMTGGDRARVFLKNLIDESPSEELREKAVAGIAQDESDAAANLLLSLARNHASAAVRKDALFWLGQKAGEKVAGELEEATEDPDEEVREMAVFSISRLPKEQSVPKLIELARKHKSRGVREQAMFWLGQSGDPRALDFIEEILTR